MIDIQEEEGLLLLKDKINIHLNQEWMCRV